MNTHVGRVSTMGELAGGRVVVKKKGDGVKLPRHLTACNSAVLLFTVAPLKQSRLSFGRTKEQRIRGSWFFR